MKLFFHIFIFSTLILFYQNCGEGFVSQTNGSFQVSDFEPDLAGSPGDSTDTINSNPQSDIESTQDQNNDDQLTENNPNDGEANNNDPMNETDEEVGPEFTLITQVKVVSKTHTRLVIEWSTGVNTTGYINYGLNKELGSVQKKETSFKYNIHQQELIDLTPDTPYHVQVISKSEDGKEFRSKVMIIKTNEAPKIDSNGSANYLNFADFKESRKLKNFQVGDWRKDGYEEPRRDIANWEKVFILPNGHDGASAKMMLDPSIKEAWATYKMQLGKNWTPAGSVKLPGFASHINEGRYSYSGGNGGGWAGLCRSWSARSFLAAIKPGVSWSGKLSMEVYHRDSNNYAGGATPKDHPCKLSNFNPKSYTKYQFGQPLSSKGFIRDKKWHTVTHHIRLNTIGQSDGLIELYLDGKLAGKMTNLNFTDNPKYHNIAFWFIVYHGGGPDTTGTFHDIYFADFNWNSGPINLTR